MGGTSRPLTYVYDAGGRRTRITHPDGAYFGYQLSTPAARPTFVTTAIGQRWSSTSATMRAGLPDDDRPAAGDHRTGRISTPIGRLTRARPTACRRRAHNVHWTSATIRPARSPSAPATNDAYASNTAYDVTRAYSVNGLNQYTAAGRRSFTYDANGNLTSDGARPISSTTSRTGWCRRSGADHARCTTIRSGGCSRSAGVNGTDPVPLRRRRPGRRI